MEKLKNHRNMKITKKQQQQVKISLVFLCEGGPNLQPFLKIIDDRESLLISGSEGASAVFFKMAGFVDLKVELKGVT